MVIIIIILIIIISLLFIKLSKKQTELEHALAALDNKAYAVAQDAYKKAKAEMDAKLAADRKKMDEDIAREQELLNKVKSNKNDATSALERELELQKVRAMQVYEEGLTSYNRMAQSERDKTQAQIDKMNSEWSELYIQLSDYKSKVDATNAEIKRQRELAEQEEYYKIQLTPETVEDIATLNSIREKIHKREYLDKMLYDNYIAKSVKEMVKRVIGSADPSGIYRITNVLTKEAYIGKSVHVGDRWIGHVKSACGLEGVADSQFQRALKKYGIENWTFELIEECPKDKLTEREKYYIDYYDTKEYGYNMRNG